MPLRRYARIDISELPEFFDEFQEELETFKADLIESVGDEMVRKAKRLAFERMPSFGGSYRDTIGFRQRETSPEELRGELYSTHQWATAIEFGTREHDIRPRAGRAMRIGKVLEVQDGKERPYGLRYRDYDRPAKRVRHPGARAFRIFGDTFVYIGGRLNVLIERTLGRMGL